MVHQAGETCRSVRLAARELSVMGTRSRNSRLAVCSARAKVKRRLHTRSVIDLWCGNSNDPRGVEVRGEIDSAGSIPVVD